MDELTTERLLLRRWRDEDREPFAALNADPEVMRWFPSTLTRAESDALIDRIEAGFAERGFGLWVVEVVGGAPCVGFVGLSVPGFDVPFGAPSGEVVEIGWRLARDVWGCGYATEAAVTCVAAAFGSLGLDEIVSFTSEGNARSRAVMERLGMQHDPAEDFDHPSLPVGHELRRHVLYRLRRQRS